MVPVDNVRRLLKPRQIAVIGGKEAGRVIEQCRRIGYGGELWPVNPSRQSIQGIACFGAVEDLPQAPDAAFIAVPRELTVDITGRLADMGAGGAVCHASGFAELDERGRSLQRALVEGAGNMALIGPNCYGFLNYLDGAALWPDQHGGRAIDRGVAIITQSGNVSVNFSMQRRQLPLGYIITTGNQAGLSMAEYINALTQDDRITAIGLHVEAISHLRDFDESVGRARDKRVPIVMLKTGSSGLGAHTVLSHTSSLAGSDKLYDDLCRRLGIARVHSASEFLETLKFISINGPLPEPSVATISCSGGEASLAADICEPIGLALPALNPPQRRGLAEVLGERVALANPLDYHTYIWGNRDQQRRCFKAMMLGDQAVTVKLLDYPCPDICDTSEWDDTYAAFRDAARESGKSAAVMATMHENIPYDKAEQMAADGITPLYGMTEGLRAIRSAGIIGKYYAHRRAPPLASTVVETGDVATLDEFASKTMLSDYGVSPPDSRVVGRSQVAAAAVEIGYPVVIKALGDDLVHKSDVGAVKVDIRDPDSLDRAMPGLAELSDRFLVEKFIDDAVVELLIGVTVEPPFGPALTLGTGGVMVELWQDTRTRLLPLETDAIQEMLAGTRAGKLLGGYRGRPAGDVAAVNRAVQGIVKFTVDNVDRILELEVNPLLVRPDGLGAVAGDALIRMLENE